MVIVFARPVNVAGAAGSAPSLALVEIAGIVSALRLGGGAVSVTGRCAARDASLESVRTRVAVCAGYVCRMISFEQEVGV